MHRNQWRRYRTRGAERRFWRQRAFSLANKEAAELKARGFARFAAKETVRTSFPLPVFYRASYGITYARTTDGRDWRIFESVNLAPLDFFELIPSDRPSSLEEMTMVLYGRAAYV